MGHSRDLYICHCISHHCLYPYPILKRYCSDHLDGHNIRLEFSHNGIGEENRFSSDRKLVLLRVIQEACENIIAHSETDVARITLSYQKGWLEVEIVDYGRGFDPDKPAAGSGLKNMKKRVAYAGGTIEIVSHPGAGTRIGIRLPL